MATYYLCPFASFLQVLSDSGQVVTNALIWTYAAGTSTPTSTWTDSTGNTPNGNPIQLNSAGRLNNVSIWQQGGVPIKVIFTTNVGTPSVPVAGPQIGPTFDQVSGINDPAVIQTLLASSASGSGADLVANAVRSYDVISSVRAANVPSLVGGQSLAIDVQGATASTDGGGGIFFWNATSTATDDGVNVIKPTSLSVGSQGRYIRQYFKVLNTVYKTANLSRASTQTLANDPDLSITLGSAGVYMVELLLQFNCTTTSTQGFKCQLSGSATATGTGAGYQFGNGSFAAAPVLNTYNNLLYNAPADIVGTTDFLAFKGLLNVTVAGTVTLQWAQNSATNQANNTTLYANSYLSINKIG